MDKKYLNQWSIYFFYLSIAIYPLNVLLSLSLKLLGLDFVAARTIFICYALVFLFAIVLLIIFPISLKRVVSLFSIYLLYFILYWTTPSVMQEKYFGVQLLMIYTFYLPYAVLILSRINDFSLLFSSRFITIVNYFIIIGSFVAKYVFNESIGYMPYSYNLLPIWLLFSFHFIERPSLGKLGIALIMFLEGIIYGARGPLIWLAVGSVAYGILHYSEKKKELKISIIGFVRFLLFVGVVTGFILLLFRLLSSVDAPTSYILSRFDNGVISESKGRNSLTEAALQYLGEMGGAVNGLFFDRTIMPGRVYVHNLILETYLDFGWIIGSVILGGLFYFIGRTFQLASFTNKKMMFFLLSSFFLKYSLTGSIYEDYQFIIFLSLIVAIYKQEKPDKFVVYERTQSRKPHRNSI